MAHGANGYRGRDNLPDKGGGCTMPRGGGGKGIGGLLATKGDDCDLDAGAGVILVTNGGGGIVLRAISSALGMILDICGPGCKFGRAGQARHSGRRHPQRVWRPPEHVW
jgi:hypothetical protein